MTEEEEEEEEEEEIYRIKLFVDFEKKYGV